MAETDIVQLAMSFVGALGFALFFNSNPRHILISSVGGVLTWGIYWIFFQLMHQIFVPCFIASSFAAAYSEVVARLCNVPSTVFFIVSVIPLIPGRGLFYTMSDAVSSNWTAFAGNATSTLLYAAGIAAGICVVAAYVQTWKYVRFRLRRIAASAVAKASVVAKNKQAQ